MRICSLQLRNFRNYANFKIDLASRISYIFGRNAQGKTNLLEALYILAIGRSFRTNKISEAISFGADHFFLEAIFEKESHEHKISLYVDKQGKKFHYNHTPLKTISELIGLIPIVLFSTKDRSLIMGSPHERRSFLNILISQKDPLYTKHLATYTKALAHRNALIKIKNLSTAFIWEKHMAQSGAYIISSRASTIEYLSNYLKSLNPTSLSEDISLRFKTIASEESFYNIEYLEEKLLKQFACSHHKDLSLGYTSLGAQKDDFQILTNEKSSSSFASEGQKQTALAAIKLAESAYLQEHLKTSPLICMDDFQIGLDHYRTNTLLKLLPIQGQQIITSTSKPQNLPQKSQLFLIENASIKLFTNHHITEPESLAK